MQFPKLPQLWGADYWDWGSNMRSIDTNVACGSLSVKEVAAMRVSMKRENDELSP